MFGFSFWFCAPLLFIFRATIWHAVKHGYVGAHHDDGFMHPVVNQLVEELYLKFPQLIGGLELLNLWAYKSEQMYDGVPVHADQATVSFNLWITPDEANLNNENGGLLIYPKEAIKPKDWSFVDANGLDSIQLEKLLHFNCLPLVKYNVSTM